MDWNFQLSTAEASTAAFDFSFQRHFAFEYLIFEY